MWDLLKVFSCYHWNQSYNVENSGMFMYYILMGTILYGGRKVGDQRGREGGSGCHDALVQMRGDGVWRLCGGAGGPWEHGPVSRATRQKPDSRASEAVTV